MIYVDSVNVTPNKITMKVGDWYYATHTVSPENATCKSVCWGSFNKLVATVNPTTGYIYAKRQGKVKIFARACDGSGAKAYIEVTVEPRYVESIELSHSSINLHTGETFALTAQVSPDNATLKSIYWASSNKNVAKVDHNGVVTAVSAGTATIRAVAKDAGGAIATCTVEVTDILVSSIKINAPKTTMVVGDSMILKHQVEPKNATNKCVCWESTNKRVARVNPHSGLVLANESGTTWIYATACDGSGVREIIQITVKEPIPIEKLKISGPCCKLIRGEKYQLTATILPENATRKSVIWKSDNTSVATVGVGNGILTAVGAGEATIQLMSRDGSGKRAYFKVEVIQTSSGNAEEGNKNMTPEGTVADPVDVYSGAHTISNTVISLYGGQGLKLALNYNSTDLACGELGTGWYHNYEKHIKLAEKTAYVYSSPTVFARYEARSSCCSVYDCKSASKNGYVLTVNTEDEYPYVIDCNSQHTEYYGADGKLAKITDHFGFETLIEHSDARTVITDTVSGKKIYLEKDENGRIVKACDDAAREAILSYSGNNLVEIRDVNGNSLYYTYDAKGRIKTGTDSNGVCYFENTYDDYGRVSSQKDAIEGSNKTYFSYDGLNRVITNRNGHISTRKYDCGGMLTSYTDENNNTKAYSYDEHNNITKTSFADGAFTGASYNRFNKPVVTVDQNGAKTHYYYDGAGNVILICYPMVNGFRAQEHFAYNSRNQLVSHRDKRGTLTTYTYDENGMPRSKKIGDKNEITYSYENGLLISQTDALDNTTRYGYNAVGQLISVIDALGSETRHEYDACGNLLKTTYANGDTVTYAYDCNHQKVSITDANGNKTEYSYNGNLKNDVITLPDGNTVRYEFDGEDRITKTVDQDNNATETVYDDGGRVLSKKLSDGALVQYEYDNVGNVTKETNPKGAVVTKTYDKRGNVLTVTDDEGNVTSYKYNAMSKVTKVTNAVGGSVSYTYSAAGDVFTETDALGNTKSYTYDAYGNRLTATDANNNVTVYTYDQNNNLLTVTDALGNVTTYTYNALNQCVSVKDALNNVIQYGYDSLGRRTTITDARGNVFTTTYDGNGNVIKTTDAKGNTISETVYNSLNQPLTVTDAMGKATAYTYNALGKVESVTDSMNHRTEFTYNSRGQNIEVRDAANNVSTATYDLLGNVTRLAGPLGGATEYNYDDMGRLVSESTVSGGAKSYEYNELNVRKKITNARGQIRQIFYDAMGRITGYTSPEGAVSYTYDANSNVLTVNDSHGTITRTYDALNRVSSYTDTYGKVIRYEYDAVGNLSKIIYPDNTAVTYAYDANHNLIRVTDWANRVTSYTYDENNRVIGVTKPDGSVTTTVYDSKQRVTSTVERTAGGGVITGFEYTYDDLSRIVEEKVLANSTKMCYAYDDLGRVTARTVKKLSDNSVVSTETFSYDAAGNVTYAPDSSFQYDTNNRLISFNGGEVSYDLDGNMLSNGSLTCSYDSANRLVSAGGHTYTYNAEDVRIRNLCTDEDTTYTYNTNAKLSMLLMKTTNGVVTKYVYGRGLIGEEVGSVFKTYHFDARGSTIAITDASGNITDVFAYDTYGKIILHTGTSEAIFLFDGIDGIISDSNGLYYMRARYYSPSMKRFVNSDIVAGDISNAVTLNRFTYANGNPVSFVDPIGLSFLLTLGLIALGAVIGGTVSAVSSVVEQKKEKGEVDWEEVAVDATWGALEGGIAASPLGFAGQTIASGVIRAGQSITDQYFDSDNKEEFDLSDVDYLEVGTSVAIDVGFSMIDIKKPNKTKELNKVVSALDDKIARETRRANQEVAQKRIAEASLKESNAIRGAVTDMLIDPFSPKQIAQNSAEFVVDKLFFDNYEETYSRK